MKILISEDNDHKYRDLINVLKGMNIDNLEITRVESRNKTVITFRENEFDFIIQDMQMPSYENESKIDISAGVYVLRNIMRKEKSFDLNNSFFFSSAEQSEYIEQLKISKLDEIKWVNYQYDNNSWVSEVVDIINKYKNSK